jgi:methionyl-tRNA formyltransferase
MKIFILTTETLHHAFFVHALNMAFGNIMVFCEHPTAGSSRHIQHQYEHERDRYERQLWFNGDYVHLADIADTKVFTSMNKPEALQALREYQSDVVFVFGTGLLNNQCIALFPNRIFNLHGGNPEEYRGLDSHLWAIYHKDFTGLVSTLHRLDAGLDTGEIVLQGSLPIKLNMPLYALRAVNTEICVKLATATMDMIIRNGDVVSRPQRRIGRYYSAMPTELKETCRKYFEAYTQGVANAP